MGSQTKACIAQACTCLTMKHSRSHLCGVKLVVCGAALQRHLQRRVGCAAPGAHCKAPWKGRQGGAHYWRRRVVAPPNLPRFKRHWRPGQASQPSTQDGCIPEQPQQNQVIPAQLPCPSLTRQSDRLRFLPVALGEAEGRWGQAGAARVCGKDSRGWQV